MKRASLSLSILGFAAGLVLVGCSGSVSGPPVPHPSAIPVASIQHVVIMVQENRSFENLFAGFPGANAPMEGPCKPGPAWCKTAREVPLTPVRLDTGSPSLGGTDICHSHQCFKIECDYDKAAQTCRMDGFDLIDFGEIQGGVPAKLYPYRYVYRSQTQRYWELAQAYALADNMYSTDTASSFIAHQEILSGTVALNDDESLTDQPTAPPWGCDAAPGTETPILLKDGREIYPPNKLTPFPCFTQYKTIADLLDAADTSWKYYVMPLPGNPHAEYSGAFWNGFDAIKAVRYSSDWNTHIIRPNYRVFTNLTAGTLPEVSWVIPTLYDSDHPASGCNGGPWWVTRVVNAIGTSRYWKNTAIILLWDDWGGWYDNAPPMQINYTSLGMRVPMIVISPFAKPHYISHTLYDFGTILKFVEQNFGLGSLGTTDATANSMNDIFDFTQSPNVFKPAPLPPVEACGKTDEESPATIRQIIRHAGAPPE